MANVNIKFNNKDYLLSCDDGQEESLKKLTKFLDKKYSELKDKLGNIGENKLLLITSITVMDEYFETKKKIDQQKNEIKEITDKFKELKSLVYDYKNSKENEIYNLSESHSKLKNELETYTVDFEWTPGEFELQSKTAYSAFKYDEYCDCDGSGADIFGAGIECMRAGLGRAISVATEVGQHKPPCRILLQKASC